MTDFTQARISALHFMERMERARRYTAERDGGDPLDFPVFEGPIKETLMSNICPHCGKPYRFRRSVSRETGKEQTLWWCQHCRWTPGLQNQADDKTGQREKEPQND